MLLNYRLAPFTLELSCGLSEFSNGKNLCYLRVISKAISNTNENETETWTGIHISLKAWSIWSRAMTKARHTRTASHWVFQSVFQEHSKLLVSHFFLKANIFRAAQSVDIYWLTGMKSQEKKSHANSECQFGAFLSLHLLWVWQDGGWAWEPWLSCSILSCQWLYDVLFTGHLRVIIPPLVPLGFQNRVSKASGISFSKSLGIFLEALPNKPLAWRPLPSWTCLLLKCSAGACPLCPSSPWNFNSFIHSFKYHLILKWGWTHQAYI